MIAQTGWTTDELASAVRGAPPRGSWDVVFLQIGVNDQYRDRSESEFTASLTDLMDLVEDVAADAEVIMVGIPDWSPTPFAAGDDRPAEAIRSKIARFNAIESDLAEKRGWSWVDIFHVSLTPPLADDELHPGRHTHKIWADAVLKSANKS